MQLSIVCPTTPMTGMGGGRVGIRQLGKCNCPTPWAVIESNPPINLPPSSFQTAQITSLYNSAIEDKDFLHPSATGQTEIQVLAL